MKAWRRSTVCLCEEIVTEALGEHITLVTQALCHIGKLYKVKYEADESGISIEEGKEKCIQESYPVILEFENWMYDTYFNALLMSLLDTPFHFHLGFPDMSITEGEYR